MFFRVGNLIWFIATIYAYFHKNVFLFMDFYFFKFKRRFGDKYQISIMFLIGYVFVVYYNNNNKCLQASSLMDEMS